MTETEAGTYSHDANGNTISKVEGSKRWTYFWDFENRLAQAWDRKNRVRYRYDALGRRVARYAGANGSTKFTYDGEDVLLDDDASGTVTKYLNGPGIDNKLRSKAGSDVKYFLTDHLGSTNGLADATGSLTATTGYDAFGNATNAAFPTRYQFTGREYDTFTGMYFYRARWYDSTLGRFISEDPIGFGGGDLNLYAYVWNDPLHFIDPFGLNGGGTRFADWADERIEYARNYYQGNDQEWIRNGLVNTGADLSFGAADMFRVGNGSGHALYAPDENGYGRAAFVAMDIARAAGLATALGFPGARFAQSPTGIALNSKITACFPGKEFVFRDGTRIAPFGNRTGHPTGEKPHYHRQRRDSKGNVLSGQGKRRHRPWDKKSTDKRFWDRF